MKTTKEERKWLTFNWRPQGSTFRQWVAGSSKAHALIPSLIADVEDAARLLGVVLEEIKNGEIETNYSQRVCAKSIANFLKEPK